MDATVEVAIIAGAVSLVTSLVSASVTTKLATRRAGVDEKLAKLKSDSDRDLKKMEAEFNQRLTEQKVRLENRSKFAAGEAALRFFADPQFPQRRRSFDAIKSKIRGFTDDELRQILIGIGAVAGTIKVRGVDKEGWHLAEGNQSDQE